MPAAPGLNRGAAGISAFYPGKSFKQAQREAAE